MYNLLKGLFVGGLLLALVSCTETNLRYLGYTYWGGSDPVVDYSYWGREPDRDVKFGTTPSRLDGGYDAFMNSPIFPRGRSIKTHGHRLVRDYIYAVFCPEGYVSECDIEDFKRIMSAATQRNLKRMLASMNRNVFVYESLNKEWLPVLSEGVREAVTGVPSTNHYSDLGGWQIFKPTEGIDTSAVFYRVQSRGDGWLDIFSPKGQDTVSVKVAYVGKHMTPVIVGVCNKRMNIDILDDIHGVDVSDKRFAVTPYDDEYMYLKFLCPMLYRSAQPGNLVTEEDIDRFKDKANALKLAFVEEFCRSLLKSGDDMRKIRRKYRKSMAQRFAGMTDFRVQKKNYSVDMFLPCGYGEFAAGGYAVTYLGNDWYQVTAGGKSLKLKVVLYGKRLTPAIMGMRNPVRNIDYCPVRFTWLDGD